MGKSCMTLIWFLIIFKVGVVVIQSGGLTRQLIGWQRRVSCMAF
jgi:hypothetical protein